MPRSTKLKATPKAKHSVAAAAVIAAFNAAVAADAIAAELDAINHSISLTQRDEENAKEIREMALQARAKNTDKNYIPKQQEFID